MTTRAAGSPHPLAEDLAAAQSDQDQPLERDAQGAHCITCGDEGIRVAVIVTDDQTALCADPDGVVHSVAVDLVAPVAVGDELLVHAGVAIRQLGAAA
ncbi:MAG: HypC/HybG/HupF family hydrogenase formation chaperone [Solirubrobacteraceae bacterium]